MNDRQQVVARGYEGAPQSSSEMESLDLPLLAARIEEITALLSNDGQVGQSARMHALRMIETEPLFEPFWDEARKTDADPESEFVLALAKARLEGARAHRQVALDLPDSPQPISEKGFFAKLGETLLIPWVLAVLIAAVTAIITVRQEIASHRANKVFDADYERTVGIVKELTGIIITAGDLKADLMGEEQGSRGQLDAYRSSRYLKRADGLADSLTRTTDLFSYGEEFSARKAQAVAFLEVEKLRFCLASQRVSALRQGPQEVERKGAEQELRRVPDRFQPPLPDELKKELLLGLRIQYPCGVNFDITPFDDLRSATREFLFSKLGSQVFVSEEERR